MRGSRLALSDGLLGLSARLSRAITGRAGGFVHKRWLGSGQKFIKSGRTHALWPASRKPEPLLRPGIAFLYIRGSGDEGRPRVHGRRRATVLKAH